MHDGMIGAAVRRGTRAFGVAPVRTVDLAPPGSGGDRVFDELVEAVLRQVHPEDERPSVDFRLGAVAGVFGERCEVAICNRKCIDAKRRERDGADRAFAVGGKGVGVVRAHQERAAGQRDGGSRAVCEVRVAGRFGARGARLLAVFGRRRAARFRIHHRQLYWGLGGAVRPGVPPSLPGTSWSFGCRLRVPGGCSAQTSVQLLPTLVTDSTWIDAAVEAVRGTRMPCKSISWPTSFSVADLPVSRAHTLGVLMTRLDVPGSFCTHPVNAPGFAAGAALAGACADARPVQLAIAMPKAMPRAVP